jgi:hypothetical protein
MCHCKAIAHSRRNLHLQLTGPGLNRNNPDAKPIAKVIFLHHGSYYFSGKFLHIIHFLEDASKQRFSFFLRSQEDTNI